MPSRGNPGTLYVCPTPIGNLEDVTGRVLRTLGEVDLVAAEDTRVTAKLLNRYAISKPMVSYREYSEAKRIEGILGKLDEGKSVALVSDAGTPGLSDPGHRLIRAAIDGGYRVEVLPGPSAVVTALIASGLPTDSFVYQGFLPKKSAERRRLLKELVDGGKTAVVYESPHRIIKVLGELSEMTGERRIVLARELTKKFEEVIRGSAREIIERLGDRPRGEMILLIGPGEKTQVEVADEDLAKRVRDLVESGMPKKEAISEVSGKTGAAKRAVYEAAKGIRAKGTSGA